MFPSASNPYSGNILAKQRARVNSQPVHHHNYIPGVNVDAGLHQLGSYLGLAPKKDYNVLDNISVTGGAREPVDGGLIGNSYRIGWTQPKPKGTGQITDSGGTGTTVTNPTGTGAPQYTQSQLNAYNDYYNQAGDLLGQAGSARGKILGNIDENKKAPQTHSYKNSNSNSCIAGCSSRFANIAGSPQTSTTRN